MKTLCLFISMLPLFQAFAQDHVPPALSTDPATGKFTTSGVVQIDSKSRQLLTEGAYKWLSDIKYASSSASKGIKTDEAFFGRIIVSQYFISVPETFTTKVRFILTLEFRDGRYRYQFTDFSYLQVTKRKEFEEAATNPTDKVFVLKLLNESNAYIRNFVSELTTYLAGYSEDNSW
jgi:hypothetical protein